MNYLMSVKTLEVMLWNRCVICKVVKRIIHAIVLPLVHVFNLSIESGKVPLKLKESKVIPVF